jgi:Sulfotransferase domain.
MLPKLIVVGAQKSGTTALFAMLSKHPKAIPPQQKELHFFNRDTEYAMGMGHYRSYFPIVPVKGSGYFTFEASPGYLFHAVKTAPRIARDLPGVLCVAILRDPVKRAFSAWNMYRKFQGHPKYDHLYETRHFAQAVEDELNGRTVHLAHFYLARGAYASQVRHFIEALPPGSLMVKSYADLKRDPNAFMNEICDKLSLPHFPEGAALKESKAGVLPYHEKLDPALAAELYRYFAPEMERLKAVLGYELDILEGHG